MKNKNLTLGSLFSGSGGFELAGTLAGIKPLWNSEVEPFPIAVTCRRFPDVKHYGDVSALSGEDLEPVDIITFGSPCTDLSIAGKRAGLEGERSGLFYEAIRIIKEMRRRTNGEKPRFAVWENVFGAFSSNRGEDFKAVLDALVKIAEPEAPEVPMPPKGDWPYADIVMGDGFSVAYRVLDAQWWGVPQRRRRVFLVADFRGRSAGKVLFKSEGMSRYTPQGFRSWEGTPGNLTQSPRTAGFCTEHSANSRSIGYEEERIPTLRAGVVPAVVPLENHPADSRIKIEEDGKVQTLSSRMGTGGNNVPLLMEEKPMAFTQNQRNEVRDLGDKSAALQAEPGMKQQTFVLQGNMIGRDDKNGPQGCGVSEDVCYTLTDVDRHAVVAPDSDCTPADTVYAMTTECFTHVEKDVSPTLMARDYKDPTTVAPVKEVEPHYTVRRLTPTECAQLQGFPDWWCSDLGNPDPTDEEVAFWMDVWETHRKVVSHASKPKTERQVRKWLADPYSDAAEYKLWGNGVALPCVHFVMCGIAWAAGDC